MRSRRLLGTSLLAAAAISCPLWAQDEEPLAETPSQVEDVPAEERVERIRDEMAASVARLEDLRRELADREQDLAEAKSDPLTPALPTARRG